MKIRFVYSLAIAFTAILAAENAIAQDVVGGTVKYQQTTKYNFEAVFDPESMERVKEYLGGTVPTEGKQVKVLYFTAEAALYEEDPTPVEDQRLQGVLMRANMMKTPQAELEKVFYDFGKNEMTRHLVFMTRDFAIESEIERKAWKLTNKRVKVLDRTCMGAELKEGDDTITAWFSPEIPISAGPGEFFGLPGLILVVEINGETAFMATSIDLTPPKEDALSKPEDGKKVTREEFDQIMEEKVKEYRETKGEGRDRRRR